MRPSSKLFALLVAITCSASAQTGFTLHTYPATGGGGSILVSDFNRDGKPDLLVGGAVYLNNGSGGFGAALSLSPPNSVGPEQVGDLNRDGASDVAACTYTSATNAWALTTYLNDGTGHFAVHQTIPLSGTCTGVNLWDINQDGSLDAVTTTSTYNSTTSSYVNQTQVWFNLGGGNLSNSPVVQKYNLDDPNGANNGEFGCSLNEAVLADFYKNTAHPGIMLFADCNGAQGPINSGTVWFAQSVGDGHFSSLSEIQGGGTGYGDGAYPKAQDLNLDGKPDVLTVSAQYGPHGSYNSDVLAVLNNGAPNFFWNAIHNENAYAGVGGFNNAAAGGVDLNGDGQGDIAAAFNETDSNFNNIEYLAILNGSANGQYSESQRWTVGNGLNLRVLDIATGDFNNDGRPDIAALVNDQNTGATILYIYLNTQGTVACAPPSSPGVHVCAPQKGQTYSSPVQFEAGGTGASGSVERMELWIDGKKISNYFFSTVKTQVSLANGQHSATFIEVDSAGAYIKSAPITFAVGSGGGGGSCIPSTYIAQICKPAAGATVSSPVEIQAGAQAANANITAIRVYVDNVSVGTFSNPSTSHTFSIDRSFGIAAGKHNLVIVAYQSSGGSQSASETFTIGGGGGSCVPSQPGATICSPGRNATVTSPVQVTAGTTAVSGYITAIRVYVDGVAVYFSTDPSHNVSYSINRSISMSKGKHNLVVVGYQSTGGSVSVNDSITVQ